MKNYSFSAQELNNIIRMLEEMPWKYAHPIMEQLKSIVVKNEKAPEKSLADKEMDK